MKKLSKLLIVTTALAIISGCASVSKMPLKDNIKELDTSTNSVLLGKLSIRNENKPSSQPNLVAIFVEKDGKKLSFTKPTLISEEAKVGKGYFISLSAKPGKATLEFARFQRHIPLLMNALADLKFDQELDIPANKIVYIGDITATIVKRENDEPRAGLLIPLIDQSVAGFSNGTFKVEIKDNYEKDIAELKAQFPYLNGKEIVKAILPDWVHPKFRGTEEKE